MAANPVYANVAFLRIPQFDSRPVVEQAAMKEKAEERAREAIASLAGAERVVLDAEDGLAVIFFGDPAQALRIAESLSAPDAEPALQTGLNYGPLALAADSTGTRVFGDGLTAAAAAARFAQPRRLLVTQDFARALERRNPSRAMELATAGDFTDTRVRQHSFYTPDAKRAGAYRRRMLTFGILGVAAILATGFAAREIAKRLFPPAPAVVTFNVKPRGDVYVDGVYRGSVPPLTQVEVAPGTRAIEIRNARLAPYSATFDLKPGERTEINHTFVIPRMVPPQKPQPQQEQPGFWQSLKRQFGGG